MFIEMRRLPFFSPVGTACAPSYECSKLHYLYESFDNLKTDMPPLRGNLASRGCLSLEKLKPNAAISVLIKGILENAQL